MNADLRMRVATVLREEIVPALELDGGSIELVDVADGIAQVRFGGACASCPSTIWPLIMGLEQELRLARARNRNRGSRAVNELLFGYNTNGFAHHRLEDAIAIIYSLGYRSIALTLDHHALLPWDDDHSPELLQVWRERLGALEMVGVVETGTDLCLTRSVNTSQPY